MFTSPNKEFHRARRQVIGQILTDKSMHAFEPTMTSQVDIFVQQLLDDSEKASAVNISERTRRLTTDIASLLGFGYDLGLQVHEENRFLLPIIDKVMPMSNLFYHWYSLRTKLRWISVFFSSEMRERYLGLMEKMVKSRMALDKDARHDLYSFVADDLDSGSGSLRQSDLWAECNFFLTAAGETSKSALSATFFYLSRNPGCYRKLADEIRSTFSSGSDIRGTSLAGCRYLRACIDESLRISPPGPGIFWRERAADDSDSQPLVIDGHVIPPGTVFGLNTYSLHHDENYFPDSFAYIPERWLGSDESTKRANNAFAAFSVGARACAGKSVAYLEMGLVIAKTLWHLDFEAAPGPLGSIGAGGPGLGLGRDKPVPTTMARVCWGAFESFASLQACHNRAWLFSLAVIIHPSKVIRHPQARICELLGLCCPDAEGGP
ncbi:putative Cytochrome P450 [Seiridium cardinale]